MNDSYSIDFKGTPQGEPDSTTPEAKKIMADALKVLFKMMILKAKAELCARAVMAFCIKYKGMKPDSVDWETKEKIMDEGNTLMDAWKGSLKELKKLDDEYEEVRKRAKAYYGKDVMPKHEYPPEFEQMYKEMMEDDDSDWWKQG